MMNGGDDASANGGGGGGEDAAMVVVDQQPTEPGLLLSAAAASNNGGGGGNEEAEAVEDEEMAEQQGENGDGGTNAASSSRNSSSRYSLRKRSRQPLLSIQDNSSKQTGPNSKTSRGGSKKQQPSSYQADAFGYVDTSTLTDRQFERLLAQYEEDGARQREQKKQRIERGYADDDYPYVPPPEGDRPAFDDLPKEAIQRVFEFLPTVRAVFNLAYQSKYMMSFVEERMDIVVRATVLEDIPKWSSPPGKLILTRIIELVRKRSIHTPSPLRLLKLINAKRCERGADCFAFNLKTGLASKTDMGTYRPYGFAICGACATDCSARKPRNWNYWSNHWSRQEDKLIHHAWSKVFHPDRGSDLCIGVDGERLGPFLNAKHIQQIYTAHRHDIDQQKKMFAAIVEKEYGEEGSDEMEAFDKACADLEQIFDQASEERKVRHDAYYEAISKEQEAKNAAAVATKKAKLEPIIAALEESVSDAPLKELALAFEWKDSNYEPVKFQYHFVKDSLGKLLSTPSSASQKKIKAACANIRRKLEILSATSQAEGDEGEAGDDFFSLSFLSTARAETSSSLRKKSLKGISEYCKVNLTGGIKGIIGGEHWWYGQNDRNMTNDRFFDLLEGGPEKYVDAVLHILSSRRNALKDIVSQVLVSSTSTNMSNHRDLAKVVWSRKTEDETENGFTQASFFEALSLCQTEFRTMKINARDYLEEEAVKQFLAAGGMDNRVHQSVDQVWISRNSILRVSPYNNIQIPADIQNLKPYHLLLDRDFASLLRIHRFYRNHISSYGSYRPSVAWLHQSVPDNAN